MHKASEKKQTPYLKYLTEYLLFNSIKEIHRQSWVWLSADADNIKTAKYQLIKQSVSYH